MEKTVVINKARYRLYTYAIDLETGRFEKHMSIPCAVGMPEYATPTGVFKVGGRSLNPGWKIPDSPWIDHEWRETWQGSEAGPYVIPGGDPQNPLTGAFLDLNFLGVGIHGTANLDSLGTRASHGCIRVSTENAVKLYHRIDTGTIVTIV